jgi:hypothetical protein
MDSDGHERDRVNFELPGQMVVSHLCQGSVVLTMTGGYVVVLEAPFTVTTPEASTRCDPGLIVESAGVEGDLVGQIIDACTVDDAGSLSVTFTSGIRLQVNPDDGFEAWTVSGPEGMLVVCTPGGRLAVWSGAGAGPTRHPNPSEQLAKKEGKS